LTTSLRQYVTIKDEYKLSYEKYTFYTLSNLLNLYELNHIGPIMHRLEALDPYVYNSCTACELVAVYVKVTCECGLS